MSTHLFTQKFVKIFNEFIYNLQTNNVKELKNNLQRKQLSIDYVLPVSKNRILVNLGQINLTNSYEITVYLIVSLTQPHFTWVCLVKSQLWICSSGGTFEGNAVHLKQTLFSKRQTLKSRLIWIMQVLAANSVLNLKFAVLLWRKTRRVTTINRCKL